MAPRWFRENGAVSVPGPDLSRDMIDRARVGTDDAAIDYRIADLDTLELREAAFDLAYSALIFNYVCNFRVADGGATYFALMPGGDLVFTIEHPILMAATLVWMPAGSRGPIPKQSAERS
ncbi:methyltransferase domain-containing protein [Paracoccus sp. NGMCC 1.201697]|uniref:Methyltransferase domain-containing protein n=1 Tax=Paracoccus broussonetiae subsp. drimophilus TaxID=3373869 RepID=A0ABW7LFL3_9RHOB